MLIVSKLDELLEEKKISADDLADLTELTRMTIYNARQGKGVALKTAMKISKALDVPVNEIWQEAETDPTSDEEEAA